MNSFGSFTIGAVLGAAALLGLAFYTDPDSKALKEKFLKNHEEPDVDSMESADQSEKEECTENISGNENKETSSSDPVKNV